MVGHSGKLGPAIEAETLDHALRGWKRNEGVSGHMLVTVDHNVECGSRNVRAYGAYQ